MNKSVIAAVATCVLLAASMIFLFVRVARIEATVRALTDKQNDATTTTVPKLRELNRRWQAAPSLGEKMAVPPSHEGDAGTGHLQQGKPSSGSIDEPEDLDARSTAEESAAAWAEFEREPVDQGWARSMAFDVKSAFEKRFLGTATFGNIECRSRSCALSVSYEGGVKTMPMVKAVYVELARSTGRKLALSFIESEGDSAGGRISGIYYVRFRDRLIGEDD